MALGAEGAPLASAAARGTPFLICGGGGGISRGEPLWLWLWLWLLPSRGEAPREGLATPPRGEPLPPRGEAARDEAPVATRATTPAVHATMRVRNAERREGGMGGCQGCQYRTVYNDAHHPYTILELEEYRTFYYLHWSVVLRIHACMYLSVRTGRC